MIPMELEFVPYTRTHNISMHRVQIQSVAHQQFAFGRNRDIVLPKNARQKRVGPLVFAAVLGPTACSSIVCVGSITNGGACHQLMTFSQFFSPYQLPKSNMLFGQKHSSSIGRILVVEIVRIIKNNILFFKR